MPVEREPNHRQLSFLKDGLTVREFERNPFGDMLRKAFGEGRAARDVKVDVEGDLPDCAVREFLLRSRTVEGWMFGIAGSSIRNLIMGFESQLGDIDVAVGRPNGARQLGMHEDVFMDIIVNNRSVFEGDYRGQPLADRMHLSSPHFLSKTDDGRWAFRKHIMAAQYTFDYVGMLNTGEMVDPYDGVRDMLDDRIRLDYTNDLYMRDNPHRVSTSKSHTLTYETTVRGLFPKYKWGHRFDDATEAELANHRPHFWCGDKEFRLLTELAVWIPNAVEFIGDLRHYHLLQPLADAASSSDTVKTMTPAGVKAAELIRSGVDVEPEEKHFERMTKSERVERFLLGLDDRISKPLRHELGN